VIPSKKPIIIPAKAERENSAKEEKEVENFNRA